jgi:hypothetical protein
MPPDIWVRAFRERENVVRHRFGSHSLLASRVANTFSQPRMETSRAWKI